MSRMRFVGMLAVALVTAYVASARADDVSAKTISIKDNANPAKRQVLVQSTDPAVTFSDAVDPVSSGAVLHLYSATDDFCVTLPAGAGWVNKKNKVWKYKNKATKSAAQIKNGKLLVMIKSGVTYSLSDDGTQGTVNAQVQFGAGTRFCLRCSGNKKDKTTKFLGKDCAAAACDPEPSACAITTTTTIASTTTTTLPSAGTVLKGALTATPGRFNYNLMVGLPGANSACNTSFPGTHACTVADLQNAEAAGDLVGLEDTGSNTVNSFWAIDGAQPALQQCNDDAVGGSGLNWEYGTAHTPSRGQKLPLTNATGTLGTLQSGLQCNLSGNSWVGCCL